MRGIGLYLQKICKVLEIDVHKPDTNISWFEAYQSKIASRGINFKYLDLILRGRSKLVSLLQDIL